MFVYSFRFVNGFFLCCFIIIYVLFFILFILFSIHYIYFAFSWLCVNKKLYYFAFPLFSAFSFSFIVYLCVCVVSVCILFHSAPLNSLSALFFCIMLQFLLNRFCATFGIQALNNKLSFLFSHFLHSHSYSFLSLSLSTDTAFEVPIQTPHVDSAMSMSIYLSVCLF